MMKTIYVSFLLSLCTTITFSQREISGTVNDAQTYQPVPYVNIGIRNSSIGTVSDDMGEFKLEISDEADVIIFSAIGYETKSMTGSQLIDQNKISLNPKNHQIQEIEIVAQRFEEEEQIFGVKNKTRGLSIGFGSRSLGTEIGALIPISGSTYIKSANFVINHAKGDSLLFRVNIYDYSRGIIGENILYENVLISTKQRKGTITVDLTALDLILENDVLLTLEWIKDDDGKGNADITFDTKKSRKLRGVYVKKSSIGEFELMKYVKSKLKPCFYLMGRKSN